MNPLFRFFALMILAGASSAIILPGLHSAANFARSEEKPMVRSAPLPPETVLVRVNGKAITERDLTTMMMVRQVPQNLRASLRKTFLERLIDHRLLRDYLEARQVRPTPEQLEAAVRRIHRQIRAQGGDPQDVFRRYGVTDDLLRQELWLPLAWTLYTRQIIPEKAVKSRFEEQRQKYDGTELRVRQILRKLPSHAEEAARQQALQHLKQLRADILSGKLTFESAARRHSQAPSARQGGDLGFSSFRGKLPPEIARVAFSLKKGEISRPFLTSFGAHLLQVSEVRPGQLSLEDVRPQIFRELSQEKWDEVIQQLRKTARIEWVKRPQ